MKSKKEQDRTMKSIRTKGIYCRTGERTGFPNTKRRPALRLERICWLLGAALLAPGCASTNFSKKEVCPISSYQLRQEVDGFRVAIEPLTDSAEVKELFKMDLVKKGVLPVFVVATNSSASLSFLLTADQFRLANTAGESEASSPKDPASVSTAEGLTMALGLTGYLASTLLSGYSPDQAQVNNQNLQHLELPRRTLSPGGSASGYVYFSIPKEQTKPDHWTIHYKSKTLGADTEKEVSFSFAWPQQ